MPVSCLRPQTTISSPLEWYIRCIIFLVVQLEFNILLRDIMLEVDISTVSQEPQKQYGENQFK